MNDREIEIHREIWKLQEELRDVHTARTGHSVWTHRRPWDIASSCFECVKEKARGNPNP